MPPPLERRAEHQNADSARPEADALQALDPPSGTSNQQPDGDTRPKSGGDQQPSRSASVAVLGLVVALLGVGVAQYGNELSRRQNQLLADQLRGAVQQQQNGSYFQRLDRRTYLLSVLYNTDEPERVRQEAVGEFLRLDRELKETDVRNNPDRYLLMELTEDPELPLDWARLVAVHRSLRSDLSGVVLRNMNLEFMDLSDLVLKNADLSCSNLSFVNLHRAELENAKFVGTDLGGARLEDASASSADFSGARLNGADLQNTWLSDADFSAAFLVKTWFADYRGARFPAKSAEGAYVVDLFDGNSSGGAQEFNAWAFSNGATLDGGYEGWRQRASGHIIPACGAGW